MAVEMHRCEQCGAELLSEPGTTGLCPQCLLGLALSDNGAEELPTLNRPGESFSPGQILGDRYQIRSRLGGGGMGEVWQAFDLKLRVDVALKALRPELLEKERARELLRGEVRSAREVVSPHVCRIFDLVVEDGQELVSMEYIDGRTLAQILCERGPLELQEARELASQFLSGLEAIHQSGLVHRDFKPENVMVTRSGRVLVMDFGIAKALADGKTGTISGTPAYMAPEQARGASVDARADVFSAAVVLAEMIAVGGERGSEARQSLWYALRQVPAEVPEGPWAPVLEKALAFDPDARYESAQALARALEEVTLRLPGFEERQPYPGLAAFTEDDAEYFFGREIEVEAVWKKLERPHLLALIGPSGTGKSSFLQAGVLAARPEGWNSVLCTPGDWPFHILAQALVPLFAGDAEAVHQLLRFEDPDTAVSLLSRLRQRHERALIIVDQFEELFTQNPREVQEAFANLLARLAVEADVHVVLSMRDDFLVQCCAIEALAPIASDLTVLGSLSDNALRRALVQPALACGYRFEDEALVDEMVSQVSRERGALPLLAFAASRLWERRDRERGVLTRRAYEEVGGVSGALAQHAEEVLEQVGSPRLPIIREIFRNLVTAQGTRASRSVDELLSVFDVGEEREAAVDVLQTLISARLLTEYERAEGPEGKEASERRVEIIHESLLSAWPRLVRWQTQDADSNQLRDQLRQAAQMWEQRSRPDDLLWTGTSFKEYELWRERYAGRLTSHEEMFAAAMSAKATRRRRLRRFALAAVLTLALGVAAVTSSLWRRSESALRSSEASKLFALAQLRSEEDPTEALAYTTASLELSDTEQTRLFALRLLWEAPPAFELLPGGSGYLQPAFSPDGRRLAVGGRSSEVKVWSATGEAQPLILPGHTSSPQHPGSAEWASDELLVTWDGGLSQRCFVWRIPQGERVRTIDTGGPSWGCAVGQDILFAEVQEGASTALRRAAAGLPSEGFLRLRSWQLPDGEPRELGRVNQSALGARNSGFLPDGTGWFYTKGRSVYLRPLPSKDGRADQLLARHPGDLAYLGMLSAGPPARAYTTARAGEIRFWKFAKGEPKLTRVIPKLEVEPDQRHPDPSGRWAYRDLPGRTREARLWDLKAWYEARPMALRRSGSWQGASWPAFHPRGDWIVVSRNRGSRLTFWPLRGVWPSIVDSGSGRSALAFSPDSQWLATRGRTRGRTGSIGNEVRTIRLWPLPGNSTRDTRTFSLPEEFVVQDLAFDPRARFMFVVGNGDRAYVVPLDGSSSLSLERFSNETLLSSATVSPSGQTIATAFYYGGGQRTLRIWDLDTRGLSLFDLPEGSDSETRYERGIVDLAFVDESTLYTAGDGGVRRWNVETGSHELVYASEPGYLASMAVNPSELTALVHEERLEDQTEMGRPPTLLDLTTGTSRELREFGEPAIHSAIAFEGTVVAIGDREGILRVGRAFGGAPHLLVGHEGPILDVAISPDLRWVASRGEDRTMRLWPMPDLDQPPLHTLPHDELIAKLKSLTNIRVVRDPESPEGWKVELEPFPGWKDVPTWP